MNSIGKDNKSTGVFLTEEEISQSVQNKQKRTRTISQLPVFRNAVSLLDFIVDVAEHTPRTARRYTDSSIDIVNDLLKTIGLAYENVREERILCITDAIVCTYVLKAHLSVYSSKNLISKDAHNKSKKLCENTVAQLIGWRDSVVREGHNL